MPSTRSRKPLAQRPQLPAVVGQFGQALVEDRDAVEHAVEIALQMHGRRLGPFGAGRGDGDQMAGEIAAVDARNIERIERPQRRRVVPVEEMAAVSAPCFSMVVIVCVDARDGVGTG